MTYCDSNTVFRVINGFPAGISKVFVLSTCLSIVTLTIDIGDCSRVQEFHMTLVLSCDNSDPINMLLGKLHKSGANLRTLITACADNESVKLLSRFEKLEKLVLVSYYTVFFIIINGLKKSLDLNINSNLLGCFRPEMPWRTNFNGTLN